MITLKIDEPVPSLNLIVNKHWTKAREFKVHWHMLVRIAKGQARLFNTLPPFDRARVTVIRENNRPLEYDNYIGGAKYLIDGLRMHGLLVNDDKAHLEAVYLQRQIKKVEGPRTLVFIEDASQPSRAPKE